MKLAAAYPIVEGYQGSSLAGLLLPLRRPAAVPPARARRSASRRSATCATSERLHADVEYKTLNWKLRYWHNDADFYDLFGPVQRSRKGDAFIVGYNKTTIYDPPRQLDLFGIGAAYFGLEQLPAAQNVASPKNICSAEAGVRYTNTRKALGGVDHEKGIAWRAIGGVDHARRRHLPADLRRARLWRAAAAAPTARPGSMRRPGSPAAKRTARSAAFYFGSFRNNYVDNRPEKRYRELESFPGFEIDEIAARRFAKLTGEVNLPPIRFAEVGTPAFYLSYVRPAVFAGAMLTSDPGRQKPPIT